MTPLPIADCTEDAFFSGRLKIIQYRQGYRFSIDAVLLAAFAAPETAARIVDLGTGCGIIPLILGYRNPEATITGIEVQKELAELARLNAAANGMGGRIRIIHKDLKALCIRDVSGPVDLVISNPPYRKHRSGRINPRSQRAVARHEILATLEDVSAAAARVLGIGGRLAVVYPAERLTDLLTHLRSAGIEPKHIQTVHARHGEPACRVLVSGLRGGRPGAAVHEPLVIYEADGAYTGRVRAMLAP